MIYRTYELDDYLEVAYKAEEYKSSFVNLSTFLDLMVVGKYQGNIVTLVSKEQGKMNGCLVLSRAMDLSSGLLNLLFIWVDPHFPRLVYDLLKVADDVAREEGHKRIIIGTNRNPKAVARRIGKLGYHQTAVIFEKKVDSDD